MIKYEPVTVSDNMNISGERVRIKNKHKAWIFGIVAGEAVNGLYFLECSIQEFGPVSSKVTSAIVYKDDIDTIEIERET